MKKTTIALAAALASALITLPAWATKPTPQPEPINQQAQQQGQIQGQQQGQQQGQTAINHGGNVTGGAVNVRTGSPTLRAEQSLNLSVNHAAQERNPVSSAIAPGMAVSNGTCFGSSGAGVQGASFGISLGGPSLDEGCDTRYDAQALISVGEMDAAIERLCMKPEIREARRNAGRPCFADSPNAPGATVSGVCLDPSGKPYADPLVAARACPAR